MTHEKRASSSPSSTSKPPDTRLRDAVEKAWGVTEEHHDGYTSTYIDYAKLGRALVNVTKASVIAGHRHVADTVRDYARRDHLPDEGRLLFDILTEPTDRLVEQWPSLADPPDLDL